MPADQISDNSPNGAYTGERYFDRINSRESIRCIRAAFQDRVLQMAAPGAALFDFGAGPGIDARFFAERGYTVDAYDIDPEMRTFFAEYCREFIESGSITLQGGGYDEFLKAGAPRDRRPHDLIISNFAPLNQVDDLHGLFAKFHALAAPNGRVLVSVLNPCFIGDVKSRRWWRAAPRLWRDGHVVVSGGRAPPHIRRRIAEFAALSEPYFVLTRVFRDPPSRSRPPEAGIDLIRSSRWAWLHLMPSQFMTLLFERPG